MPVPRRKMSRARRDRRRAHIKLKVVRPQSCPKCKEPQIPHQVCIHCGFYKGREIVRVEEKR